MTTITKQQVIETLNAIVKEHPADYDYAMRHREVTGSDRQGACKNVLFDKDAKPQPGCIVGEALIKMGVVTPQWFFDHNAVGGSINYTVRDALLSDGVFIEDDAQVILAQAQSRQDNGTPWRLAVKEATQWLAASAHFRL